MYTFRRHIAASQDYPRSVSEMRLPRVIVRSKLSKRRPAYKTARDLCLHASLVDVSLWTVIERLPWREAWSVHEEPHSRFS